MPPMMSPFLGDAAVAVAATAAAGGGALASAGRDGDGGCAVHACRGGGAVGAAGAAACGDGAGPGCGGVGAGGENAGWAGGVGAKARGGADAAAGALTVFKTTPQCTQNFAPGWFSFPQALHFIDESFRESRVCGTLPAPALRARPDRLTSVAILIIAPSLLRCHFRDVAPRGACSPPLDYCTPPSLQPPLGATILAAHRTRLDSTLHAG